MPLFVCDECDTIDNTATGFYWARRMIRFADPHFNDKALCAACVPDQAMDGSNIRRRKTPAGTWHGRFARQTATPELLDEIGRENFVYLGRFGST